LSPIGKNTSIEDIFTALKAADMPDGINVYIMGEGRVSWGVEQVLRYGSIRPRVLCRKKTTKIEEFLPEADIVVNAIDWYPWEPRIIKKEMLKTMKETAVIIDISCDVNGAIESSIPTSWENPTYVFDGITHFCVDNLPSVIPRDSSVQLSGMIIDHVIKVANSEELSTGLMTKDGVFEYEVRRNTQ